MLNTCKKVKSLDSDDILPWMEYGDPERGDADPAHGEC